MDLIQYATSVSGPRDLADTLTAVTPVEYVRFVADWLTRSDDLTAAPALTGAPVIDALVAAAAAHAAFTTGQTVPAWTLEPARALDSMWYPGPDSLFPNALVHSPLSFLQRGVLIEAGSLASV